MIDSVLKETKDHMEKAIASLHHNLSKLRTGRASLAILDGIKVDYYGTPTPLNQVASLSIPEPRLIVVQPWEAHLIPAIEKSIEKANIGLNPSNDGKVVRLPIPQLTEDRRKEIVKNLKAMAEESRVAVRQARKEANDVLKKMKDDGLSENDQKRGIDQVQKVTDEYIQKIDQLAAVKEKDIMTV